MRRKIIAGNWKMNKDIQGTKDLITGLLKELQNIKQNCDIIICPPFTSLSEAGKLLENTVVKLGAQNMYFEESGAYTGEISASMLLSAGCEYVILGHSERRTIFNESDETINKKIKQALKAGLKPIFCIGETLEQRENNQTNDVIRNQVKGGLKDLTDLDLEKMIIAYEPIWAIGTGKNATPDQAEEVHKFIRNFIKENFSDKTAENIVIQYGGSVKPDNASELLSHPDIDGALVGGAGLKADSFTGIVKSV